MMGWFWGSKSTSTDPTKSLDADLKQFLDEQQPKPYTTSKPQEDERQKEPVPNVPSQSTTRTVDDIVAEKTLYKDGRYKDLWKTYVPAEASETVATPLEQITGAKKQRSSSLHQAALENCAFEEELKRDCFNTSDTFDRIRARLTMCGRETRAFNRCFQLQAKFMQALGYQGTAYSTPEEDEKIQMHADRLYHNMMDYEAATDEARAKGLPLPALTSVFDSSRPAPTVEDLKLPGTLEETLPQRLKDLPAHERELTTRAALQEARITQTYAEDFFKYTTTLNKDRQERQKKLINTLGPELGKFFIPDAPSEHSMRAFKDEELQKDFWKDEFNKRPVLKSEQDSKPSHT